MSWPKSCSRRGRFRMPWWGVGAAAAMVWSRRRRVRRAGQRSSRDCCRPSLAFESRAVVRLGCVNIQSLRAVQNGGGRVALQAKRPVSPARDVSGQKYLKNRGGGQSVRGGTGMEAWSKLSRGCCCPGEACGTSAVAPADTVKKAAPAKTHQEWAAPRPPRRLLICRRPRREPTLETAPKSCSRA